MARVLDSVTLPIKKNGTKTNQNYVNNPKSTAGQFSTSTAYAVGQYVYYDKKLYRFTTAHAAGAWNASHVTEVTVTSELASLKAETNDLKQDFNQFPNGNYPNMTVGSAEQLLSTVFVEDEIPYNFRTSGGSADVGDREYDEIVGVSMPINQLVKSLSNDNWSAESGVTATYDNGVVTISSATSGNGIQHRTHIATQEHKYFATMSVYGASGLTVAISGIPATSGIAIDYTISSANTWQTASKIISCGLSGNMTLYALARGGTYENVKMKDICITDLTQMLGTTIADYVYGLEQSTAGSGVSWLKHHFPKIFDSGYIPYNAGEMQSVTGLSAHKMTGFNQWDETWEVGLISGTTGQNVSGNGIRSKNMNRCIPNTSYYYKAPRNAKYVMWYDADENFISPGYRESDGVLTSPSNAVFFRLRVDGITTYSNDICINLHWDGERDGEYEEYKEYVYPLDDSVVLRGILKLDSDNKLYADGDRYLAEGKKDERFSEVDLGTLDWVYVSSGSVFAPYFYVPIPNMKQPTNIQTVAFDIICDKYVTTPRAQGTFVSGCICADVSGSTPQIQIIDTNYTGSSAFKTAMSGVKLVYPLATPTTESAEPYTSPQIVDDWGTEEYISTSLVPVGHDTKYANNLRAKLEMSPNSPDGDGDYLVRQTNGQNEYVEYVSPVPASPTANGTYTLKATVSSGTVTLSWVADS